MRRIGSSVTAEQGPLRPRSILGRVALVFALLLFGQVVLWPAHASAAVTLSVSTTTDIGTGSGDCGNTSTAVPSPLSLREATCIANNYGTSQVVTISVPSGTYTLSNGELQLGKVTGSNITLTGAGSASTIIDGNHASRVLDLDPLSAGGVTTSISGVTITNGRDGTFGGAGIIAGGGNFVDALTVSNSLISNNQANVVVPTASDKPGGGLLFQGGSLVLDNDTFSGNQSFSSAGSAVFYQAVGAPTGQTLTVTNSTFSGNATANSGASGTSGGALTVSSGAGGGTYTVSNSAFVNNTASSSSNEAAVGAAIFEITGNLTVTGSTFTGNAMSGVGTVVGGPILYTAGTAALHYDRMVGNTGTGGVMTNSGSGTADVTEDWWGCNGGPNTTGCETTSGTNITAAPRLVLAATASPSHVTGPNGTATLNASLLTDSNGGAVSASNLGAFAGLPVSFADPPGDATVTLATGAHNVGLANGVASIDYHSNTTVGPDNDSVTLDNATVTDVLEVDEPPSITSANTAAFTIGTAGTFTITTTGYPNAAITETGTLASGLSFHDNGNGSATLSGTPTAGSGGSYPLNLTANNGISPNATQTLTVSVSQPPAITSANTATFVIGSAGTFTVTTSGFPTVSTITETGTLPAGITFHDNANGTATFAGTPTGTGNTYPVTLTASNGVSPNATQPLTIQVNQAPAITLNPSTQTVAPGSSVSFSAAASGVPAPTVQWQRSTDGGSSFSNIGAATATTYTFTAASSDNGNRYRAVFTNVAGTATTTAATLNVGAAPSFTSADHTSFVVGQAGSFTITTSGVPSATLSRTGVGFPAWLTLTDNGDGTGSLTGTPPAGSAGSYQFTLNAANGFSPAASQIFTLFVDDSPVITSVDHTTFTVGQAGSFAVTTTAGFPTTTTLTETGGLPSGVTFHDNGDGTATLAGTPVAGTGGSYPITVTATASGGLAAAASQSFTLTVAAPPIITSANHATFSEGSAGSFTVTTTGASPATTTLSKTGTLPSGVSFTDNGNGTVTITGTPNAGSHGIYTITITASNGVSPDATQSFTLTVNAPPQITSADHTTFTVNTAANFTVTTTGLPTSTLSETGTLPPGTTFTDNGDGTATLGGTPTAGGSYTFTITASNGVLPNATQSFTATVNAAPVITSADHTTFAVGSAGSFTVTTTAGVPSTTTLSQTGSLPSGVTFHDNGNGTATLAGTPAVHTGGAYLLTITAANGVLPNPTQSFTLTVTEPPAITSANHTTFTVGQAANFTVTTYAGFPTTVTITETGTLPPGTSFTDNGDGTATLGGTPTAGGSYTFTITASNGVLPNATQSFTATVNAAPVITSADHTTFAVGSAGSFTVTTTAGVPSTTTLSQTGSLPSGVTFHDNGNGTATLAGTPAVHTGGAYLLTITAANGVLPNSTQSFTLTVTEPPAITSANHAQFTVGSAGNFTVTTYPGFPTTVTITEKGALPSGVTFTDNGDGTATVTGTPAPGTTGPYPLTLTVANTSGYTDQTFTLTVGKQPTTTTLAVTPSGSRAVDQAVTVTATVTPTVSIGAVTGTVSFFLDGAATAVATVWVSGGTASYVTTAAAGTHTLTATYNGDSNYQGSSSAPVSIGATTCSQIITGTHSGLTIGSGTTCVVGGHITGGINLKRGATLDLEHAVVSGSITGNGPNTVRICGSTTGAIAIAGATGFVLIGDRAENCAPNRINGSVILYNNRAGVVMKDNTITGSWLAVSNTGTGPLGQPVTVTGNHH